MKFITLFGKTPNYKRFSYEPRFYDQKAEERKEREERIRREVERERGETSATDGNYRDHMTGSFQAARRRSKRGSGEFKTAILRSAVLLFMTLLVMAYLTWGKDALYSLLLFIPIYFYFKFKK